jgi:hypothetical protein
MRLHGETVVQKENIDNYFYFCAKINFHPNETNNNPG